MKNEWMIDKAQKYKPLILLSEATIWQKTGSSNLIVAMILTIRTFSIAMTVCVRSTKTRSEKLRC